jgi:hypothetical protein
VSEERWICGAEGCDRRLPPGDQLGYCWEHLSAAYQGAMPAFTRAEVERLTARIAALEGALREIVGREPAAPADPLRWPRRLRALEEWVEEVRRLAATALGEEEG